MSEASSSESLNLGVLLFIPYRALENRVFETLAKAGFEDITVARGRIFQRIRPEGSRLTDLAEQAQVSKQAASGLVEELERAGYVTRVPDPSDARARLICVAPRGAAAVEAAAATVAEVEAEWARHLGPRRILQLRRILEALREVTDPYH
ncbi:MarR family winged helix-turn-helix transcriptional regulator [Microlunatus panaciterrae]|uniref:DNA-binding MarR family transcriptional regulator n=1 Tax=Microlunatus panaciterrae TaxID=400768 RepID=A0ABS2RGM7_9ACTN|nr:DNA-binding MarR family transcriptional regulator [Microlunatus panaciterrae]